ncbi:type II toxin-antitoxin system MqsR family toxin [Roseicella aquatilis]|uniref:Type II toxin-antitoxin system MqsR family toxin n=1 Tax=Roseicella aquatilis TaxID=2527868 RepID=A0A4R4D2D1_9PROT|nr:type II toxin-antitoxin system MqsR family toxin [Roseicella aquatilis]TCZ51106.1 type II toxin-antitoxin system MqsR family toxin [Roseicella aquatilis]
MNPHRPTYRLEEIKAAVAARGVGVSTRSSLDGIRAMGLTAAEAERVIQSLTPRQFYKTMPTHAANGEWQDVYHAPTPVGLAYVKFTLRRSGAIAISFKEK